MRMQFDVAIIGGGLVGLSLARALGGSGLSVALVERTPAPLLDAPPPGKAGKRWVILRKNIWSCKGL